MTFPQRPTTLFRIMYSLYDLSVSLREESDTRTLNIPVLWIPEHLCNICIYFHDFKGSVLRYTSWNVLKLLNSKLYFKICFLMAKSIYYHLNLNVEFYYPFSLSPPLWPLWINFPSSFICTQILAIYIYIFNWILKQDIIP